MLWYVTWSVAGALIVALFILLIRELLRMKSLGERAVSARITFIFVAIFVIIVAAIIGPNVVDESMLDRQFAPLLERDYPGWDYEVFSYCRSASCGGHGRGYLLTNGSYPGLRISVDYRFEDEFVDQGVPYGPVASNILSDDGYFSDADDIEAFFDAWNTSRPDPDSIIGSVWPVNIANGSDRFVVYATGGKNASGFDSPVVEWRAEFQRDPATGVWIAGPFTRMDENGD